MKEEGRIQDPGRSRSGLVGVVCLYKGGEWRLVAQGRGVEAEVRHP